MAALLNAGNYQSPHSRMNALLLSTLRYMHLATGRDSAKNYSQRRDLRIVQGIFAGLAGRGVAAVVSFISVPLTVRYLGAERYGAWVTISTAIAWIALADFGLSNSLTNVVSESYAKDRQDLAQSYVASAFWSLAAIAAVLAGIFFSVWPHTPWNRVFNVQTLQAREEVAPAVAVAFAIFVLSFPFSTIAKIYGAYQEVAIANAWTAAGNLLGLAALVAVTQLKGGLVSLVVAASGAILFTNIISAFWLFGYSKPWLLPRLKLVTWSSMRKLSSLGGMFFTIQISALILFQTDNLIIAHYLGAAAVTPYSVTWRLFSYTWLFQVLAGPSYWPAYAEAFSRGDREWVRRRFKTNLRITIISTTALAFPLVVFGQWFIQKWAGKAAIPPSSLLLWMGIWSLVYTTTCSQSCILASSSRLRGQMIYSAAAAAVNIVVSVVLVRHIGITGAILGTLIAYFVCVLIPQWMEVERAIRDDSAILVQSG